MDIKSIEIKYYDFAKFGSATVEGVKHVKTLPFISVVQSLVGSYEITVDKKQTADTGDGGIFIAPSGATQTIIHHLNKEKSFFEARYIFIDAVINAKHRLDTVYEFPVAADKALTQKLNNDLDAYEKSDNVCDRMCAIYTIVKHLIEAASEKSIDRLHVISPLTEYISKNYPSRITVEKMAEIMKMSESGLYAVFKKTAGISPIKYLNDHRLSVASGLLLQTDKSIQSIAEEIGMYDQFYFCKLFKRRYLCTPTEYRKSYSDITSAQDTLNTRGVVP